MSNVWKMMEADTSQKASLTTKYLRKTKKLMLFLRRRWTIENNSFDWREKNASTLDINKQIQKQCCYLDQNFWIASVWEFYGEPPPFEKTSSEMGWELYRLSSPIA